MYSQAKPFKQKPLAIVFTLGFHTLVLIALYHFSDIHVPPKPKPIKTVLVSPEQLKQLQQSAADTQQTIDAPETPSEPAAEITNTPPQPDPALVAEQLAAEQAAQAQQKAEQAAQIKQAQRSAEEAAKAKAAQDQHKAAEAAKAKALQDQRKAAEAAKAVQDQRKATEAAKAKAAQDQRKAAEATKLKAVQDQRKAAEAAKAKALQDQRKAAEAAKAKALQDQRKAAEAAKAKAVQDQRKAAEAAKAKAAQDKRKAEQQAAAAEKKSAQSATQQKAQARQVASDAKAKFSQKIYSRWNPPLGSTGQTVSVRFLLDESGQVKSFRVTKSSGDANVDASIKQAVYAAAPYPMPTDREARLVSQEVSSSFRVK